MAEANLTLEQLNIFAITSEQLTSMSLTQLKEMANSLGIDITEVTPVRSKLIQDIKDCLKRHGRMLEENTMNNEESVVLNVSETLKTDINNHEFKMNGNELSADMKFQLEMKKLEIQVQLEGKRIEVQLKEKELEKERIASNERIELAKSRSSTHTIQETNNVELYKFKKHVPSMENIEIDEFFMVFERNSIDYKFPEDKKAVLLRSALTKGKALDVVLNLTPEECNDYELIKSRVLLSYVLTPEKYRKLYREYKKEPEVSHVDFLRLEKKYFDRWLRSKNVNKDYEKLYNLILMEDFTEKIRTDIKVHLADRGIEIAEQAAVKADEYVIIHPHSHYFQNDRTSLRTQNSNTERKLRSTEDKSKQKADKQENSSFVQKRITCTFCKKDGHIKENCWSLHKEKRPIKNKNNVVLSHIAVQTETHINKTAHKRIKADRKTFDVSHEEMAKHACPSCSKSEKVFEMKTEAIEHSSFNSKGSVTDEQSVNKTFTYGGSSVARNSVGRELPECMLSDVSEGYVSPIDNQARERKIKILRDSGADISLLLKNTVPTSKLTHTGQYALISTMAGTLTAPLHRIQLKSNYFTGSVIVGIVKKFPYRGISLLLGSDIAKNQVHPVLKETKDSVQCRNTENSVCVITRAMEKQQMTDESTKKPEPTPEIDLQATFMADVLGGHSSHTDQNNLSPRQLLILAQGKDPEIGKLKEEAKNEGELETMAAGYYLRDELLMRKWRGKENDDETCSEVHQIVVPNVYRKDILHMAHDSPYAGHLGIQKTFDRILPYFFWPGLRRDVTSFCRSCHVCQMVGKPNQTIPVAPLRPIPAFSEPFSHIIIDCVGPLPKTKAGHQYLFTIMCSATRFPEAIPLRSINADKISDALIGFFTRYGLPKTVQSDQGSNFTSKLFRQVLERLGIRHAVSSAYHPQSQGALERYHQTLKNMLRTFCFEHNDDWDRGIPFALFATREAVQESLGFSPFELVFGHTVRGPLKLLQETWLSSTEDTGLLTYVENFKNRLYNALKVVRSNLLQAQDKMKVYYDVNARTRIFQPGDKVLMLTPLSGQPLSAKFTGPYEVMAKLSEVNYLVKTPDRRKSQRVCHINMLKPYITREEQKVVASVNTVIKVGNNSPEIEREVAESKLQNTKALKNLNEKLAHLPDCEQSAIKGLINENIHLFGDVPSRTSVVKHDVILNENTKAIKQHPYRSNPIQLECIRKEVRYMLDNDIITPSSSDWSSPCVLVPKADGSMRFCVDYRKVNKVTKTDSYPIPRIDDLIDQVSNAKFVTKIDLLTAYFQIPLTERAQEISSFVTPDGLYKFKVMPFGMVNAPSTFQRLINTITQDIPKCHAYLDDIVVFSDDFKSHLDQLHLLFTKLTHANLTINLTKSQFCHATIEYLGHIVGNGLVKPLNAKVKAIREFPVPETCKQLRSFLGMAGYYRRFCQNFSTIACPLTNLLKKNCTFKWSNECHQAFDKLKDVLSEAPVLVTPNYSKPFKITVDACDTGMGAVISQKGDDSLEHPISFYSQKFDKHQRNYSVIEKELLGLILALKHFDFYINGSPYPIDILTDHNPLVFLSRVKQNQRIIRWSLFLQAYNLNVVYLPGKQNVVADTLSRM